MKSVKLTRRQAEPILRATFPGYRGRKISVVFTEKVRFSNLYWCGGSHADYMALRSDGSVRGLQTDDPWKDKREGSCVDLPDGVIVVKHEFFCGKDTGITIYAHPSLAPKWLETPGL